MCKNERVTILATYEYEVVQIDRLSLLLDLHIALFALLLLFLETVNGMVYHSEKLFWLKESISCIISLL